MRERPSQPPSRRPGAEGRAALVGYLPAGFPDVARRIEALRAMVDAGCDVIEVGLPYSDPVMDGPTIQARRPAGARAAASAPPTCCAPSRRSPRPASPTVVMTYWNPVERYGVDAVRRATSPPPGERA